MIGNKFWRTRLDSDLIWPVSLSDDILAASQDGRWIATNGKPGLALHAMPVSGLIEKARDLAGRGLTDDEKEEFFGRGGEGVSSRPKPGMASGGTTRKRVF